MFRHALVLGIVSFAGISSLPTTSCQALTLTTDRPVVDPMPPVPQPGCSCGCCRHCCGCCKCCKKPTYHCQGD